MELSVYNIIKRPIITNKSIELYKKLGKLTFEVHKLANKSNIKNAIEKIWAVKVDGVCVITVPGKVKVFARKNFKTVDRKKAVVTLKKGYKIDIPGMLETMGAAESTEVKKGES
jgi:large subunit ribosomal protein L23